MFDRNPPSHHCPGSVLTLVTGLGRERAITAIAGAVFPKQAQGSLVEKRRQGNRLCRDRAGIQGRQIFPRPALGDKASYSSKTAAAPYNAAYSAVSYVGPTSKALNDRIKEDVLQAQGRESVLQPVPGRFCHHLRQRPRSGYLAGKPRCSRCPRVAKARNLPEEKHQLVTDKKKTVKWFARRAPRHKGAQSGAGCGFSQVTATKIS